MWNWLAILVGLILSIGIAYGHDTTVFTFCSKDFIKIRVVTTANFFGLVYANDRDECSTLGTGEKSLFLYVALRDREASTCGVVQDHRGWSVLVKVQSHPEMETTKDSAYLVQCTEWDLEAKRSRQHLPISLQLTHEGNEASVAVVGRKYSVQIVLPSGAMHRIGSCLAFSGSRPQDMTPLLDDEGCSIGEMMSSFRAGDPLNTYAADLTMFRFNGTHEFDLQCSVVQCAAKCPPPSCFSSTRADGAGRPDGGDSDPQISRAGSVSRRIFVSDVPPRIDHILKPCVWSEDTGLIGLSVLLGTLVLLIVATCASAFKNRPCLCHFDVRDGPPSDRTFSRLSEEATSVRYRPNRSITSSMPTSSSVRGSHPRPECPPSAAILAFDDAKCRSPPGLNSILKPPDNPPCCQIGKSMDELPQAPRPHESAQNLDRLMESSLQKLKAMLPSPTDDDTSAYKQPASEKSSSSSEETATTESTEHHLYETPSGCMSTLF